MPGVLEEDACDCGTVLKMASAVPQSPQKRLPGGFSAPHFGQRFVNGAPQSPQNFLSAGLSTPHFEQRIEHQSRSDSPPFITLPASRPLLALNKASHTQIKRPPLSYTFYQPRFYQT